MHVVRELRSTGGPIAEVGLSKSGGISGTVLDDLSGSYKTFVEAIKEIISNAYDADATMVEIQFSADSARVTIHDDGEGMNPKQFSREYVRVGRSADAKPMSPSGKRERIGGKGIGSLAPARYCQRMTIRTKSKRPMLDVVDVIVPPDGLVPLAEIVPYLNVGRDFRDLFTSVACQEIGPDGTLGEVVTLRPQDVFRLRPGGRYRFTCSMSAERLSLEASIDFHELRALGERLELDQIAALWNPKLTRVADSEIEKSGTLITLEGLEEFVRNDLRFPGKSGARNVSSKSGVDRFVWLLSRMCPVAVRNSRGEIREKFDERIVGLLSPTDPLKVNIRFGDTSTGLQLLREVYAPAVSTVGTDAALCKWISLDDPEHGVSVRGYLLGSPVIIYPAELRGISIRVKGVELGTPTLFGGEALVTGPQHTALTNHITGELHIEGVDARRDILPGREGLYPESPVYRLVRRALVGSEERLGGALRGIVDEILLRSEAQASAQGFVKKLDMQRRALLDAATAIAAFAEEDPAIIDSLLTPGDDPVLLMCPDVEIRPEGKLAAFTIVREPLSRSVEFQIDYERRLLVLPEGALYLQRTVDIAGEQFEVAFKQGGKERVFCEVDPDNRFIFINWDHPVRGPMGDAQYIKHCLAAAVCGLPQLALSRYVQLIASRS